MAVTSRFNAVQSQRGAAATKKAGGNENTSAVTADRQQQRFLERRKRDAARAYLSGVSQAFIETEIPAYIAGNSPWAVHDG